MNANTPLRQWSWSANKLSRIPSIPVLAMNHCDHHKSDDDNDVDSFSETAAAYNDGDDTHYGDDTARSPPPPPPPLCDSSNGVTVASDDGFGSSECLHSSPPLQYHESGERCSCPMCRLTMYISYIYRDQRRASPHIMSARPSPEAARTPDGVLPPLPVLTKPKGVEVCPIYAAYGFCPYHRACFLPHDEASSEEPRVPRLGSAEAEVQRLIERGQELQDCDVWSCAVCGFDGIDESAEVQLGTEQVFRQCGRCSLFCYFPYITYLVENILASVGDDYQLYKTEVDRYRAMLPDLFKIPLTYEAHRVANVVFAWSLVSPAHARDAMNVVARELPHVTCMVSVGSGAGYVEHVFNRVMHDIPLRDEWLVDRTRFPTTSFDGVRCDFYGTRQIPIFAFDALALRSTYSTHVSLGGPIALYSVDCRSAVLLLCWPPFGSQQQEESSMGFEALEYFTQRGGTAVIYIGDIAATGDWRFHMLLKSQYQLVRAYPVRRELRRWCPQEMGFVYGGNDTIGVYRRRQS